MRARIENEIAAIEARASLTLYRLANISRIDGAHNAREHIAQALDMLIAMLVSEDAGESRAGEASRSVLTIAGLRDEPRRSSRDAEAHSRDDSRMRIGG